MIIQKLKNILESIPRYTLKGKTVYNIDTYYYTYEKLNKILSKRKNKASFLKKLIITDFSNPDSEIYSDYESNSSSLSNVYKGMLNNKGSNDLTRSFNSDCYIPYFIIKKAIIF